MFIKTTKDFTGTEYGIIPLYIGEFDGLYIEKPYTYAKRYYCVMECNDFENGMLADGIYLAESLEEAETELAEY